MGLGPEASPVGWQNQSCGHEGWCGHRHKTLVGPVLIRVHVHSGLTASGTALGTFGWAQSLPRGQRASRVPPQSISLASKSVVSILLVAPCCFQKSPRAGMNTAQMALTLCQALSHWADSGELRGMAALRGEVAWSHTDPLGHRPLRYQVGPGPWCLGFRISPGQSEGHRKGTRKGPGALSARLCWRATLL